MELVYEKPFFVCKAAYSERKAPQKAGFRFDPESKRFYTSELKVASRLRAYADERSKKILNQKLIDITPWTGRIHFPKGLKPLFFQPGGARFILSRNRSYTWADPGLGKTIMAALAMNSLGRIFILYFCPSFLALNVEAELLKWCIPKRRVLIETRDLDAVYPGDVWIIPDSILDRPDLHAKFEEVLRYAKACGIRVQMFVDEAHRFKNDQSGRALYLLEGFAKRVHHQAWLSGTAIPNRLLELYPILSRSAPETIDFMTKDEYGMKYCGGRWNGFGYDYKGSTNAKELASKVIGTFMQRLKKSLLGLPPLTEDILMIGADMTPALIALDRELLKQFSPQDLMGHLAPNEHLSTYRKELGKLKAKAVMPYLKSVMDDTDQNMIVGCLHKETLALLEAGLAKYDPMVIAGHTPSNKRVGIANEWQRTKSRRLIIMSSAGGLGLNMQKAHTIPLVEFSWVYSDNEQFFGRAHRYGVKHPVSVLYVTYQNSIDRRVIETNLRKKALGQTI
jgi:hypothetical protein